jgi:hypothetical protein
MKTFFLFLMTCGAIFAADAPQMRSQADKLEKDGNWREAYEVRVKLLREVSDKDSGKDLQKALDSQRRLNKVQEFDTLLTEFTEAKKDNPDFMLAAGNAYQGAEHYGQIIDNAFSRGNPSRGQWRQVQEQDRLRALQCYMQAWDAVEKGGEPEAQALRSLERALSLHRMGGNIWQFYLKTDLSEKPNYLVQQDTITSQGAPVTKGGDPDWIDLPETWKMAKSDGERWRWLLKEIGRISPKHRSEQELTWLQFCHQNYSVNTLASYSWWSQPDVKQRDGILQASTLK